MVDRRTALELLEKYRVPWQIMEHSKAVARRAEGIAKRINGDGRIDVERVAVAGLLHDIGKVKMLMEDGIMENFDVRHEAEGAKILEAEGLSELGSIVSKHGVYSLLCDPSELSLEEKILVYADATVTEDKECSLNDRFLYLMARHGAGGVKENPKLCGALKENWHKIEGIEKEIKGLME